MNLSIATISRHLLTKRHLFAWMSAVAFLVTTEALAASLTVALDGFENEKGQVLLAVYNKADGWLTPSAAVRTLSAKVRKSKEGILIKDLPIGRYAIVAVHDQNNNGKLDKNFIGIPSEPMGTSQNIKAKFGAPLFDDALFRLDRDLRITIDLYSFF